MQACQEPWEFCEGGKRGSDCVKTETQTFAEGDKRLSVAGLVLTVAARLIGRLRVASCIVALLRRNNSCLFSFHKKVCRAQVVATICTAFAVCIAIAGSLTAILAALALEPAVALDFNCSDRLLTPGPLELRH